MAQQPQDRPPGHQTSIAVRLLVALLVVLASSFGVAPRWAALSAPAAGGGLFAAVEGSIQGLVRGGCLQATLAKASPRSTPAGTAPEGCGDPAALVAGAASAPPQGTAAHGPRPWPPEARAEVSGQLTSRTPTGPPAA